MTEPTTSGPTRTVKRGNGFLAGAMTVAIIASLTLAGLAQTDNVHFGQRTDPTPAPQSAELIDAETVEQIEHGTLTSLWQEVSFNLKRNPLLRLSDTGLDMPDYFGNNWVDFEFANDYVTGWSIKLCPQTDLNVVPTDGLSWQLFRQWTTQSSTATVTYHFEVFNAENMYVDQLQPDGTTIHQEPDAQADADNHGFVLIRASAASNPWTFEEAANIATLFFQEGHARLPVECV